MLAAARVAGRGGHRRYTEQGVFGKGQGWQLAALKCFGMRPRPWFGSTRVIGALGKLSRFIAVSQVDAAVVSFYGTTVSPYTATWVLGQEEILIIRRIPKPCTQSNGLNTPVCFREPSPTTTP